MSHGLGISRIRKGIGLEIDEKNNIFIVNQMDLFETSNLLSYELIKDGESLLKGGLGGALVGGALAGGTGAVVGSIIGKKNKKVCTALKVRITVKNSHTDTVFIDVVTKKTDGILYIAALEEAQRYLSALEIVHNTNLHTSSLSTMQEDTAAELLKFHDLMERGVITNDEFDVKKAQILGL